MASKSGTDWADLLESIAETGNLSKTCREGGFPKWTFLRAMDADPDLAQRYARAREVGLDAQADRAVEEAETWRGDPAAGRLALDARKWYLSKLLPKRYGDKLAIGGADDLPPVQSAVNVSGLSEAALRELAALEVKG